MQRENLWSVVDVFVEVESFLCYGSAALFSCYSLLHFNVRSFFVFFHSWFFIVVSVFLPMLRFYISAFMSLLKLPCHAFPVITRALVCYEGFYACKRCAESKP